MIEEIRTKFETYGFNVCSRYGSRLGIKPDLIRLFFIYTSFITLGSPVIIYLVMAFGLKVKDYFMVRKHSVFDI